MNFETAIAALSLLGLLMLGGIVWLLMLPANVAGWAWRCIR